VVLPGQYLERPALIPCGDLVLEGLSHRGARRPPLLVCPPTGPGGGMDAPLVAELAWASARAGHASLRFQHRGVGGSQGTPEPGRAVEDALAAFDHLAAGAPGPIALVGVGGGCQTAAGVARARSAAALALVAPAGWPGLEELLLPILLVLPERGAPVEARQAAARLPAGGRVQVVAGADATFRAGLPQAAQAVMAWLAPRR
jgi:pimeloyl-ACP methyl ester carboxylesterase